MDTERMRRLKQLATAQGCELEPSYWAMHDGSHGHGCLIEDTEGNVTSFHDPDLDAVEQWLVDRWEAAQAKRLR